MKMVKNIAIVALSTTFMFAGIGFHMATNYSNTRMRLLLEIHMA